MKTLSGHLYLQVLIAIALGIIVGFIFPQFHPTAQLISEMFINLIRMLIAPIIFFTIVLGIAKMGDMKKVGRVGGKALLYFEIVTTVAILIGLVVANLVKPGAGVAFDHVDTAQVVKYKQQAEGVDWTEFFRHIIPQNVVGAFAQGDVLQVLVFSVLFGWALSKLGPRVESLVSTFEKLSEVFFNVLKFVMKLAPLGAFGGMAFTIGKFGLVALLPLLKLLLSVYITMFLFIFVVLGIICRMYKFSLWQYLKFIRNELLIVLGTSSSESALPGIMEKMEQLGCSRPVVGLVIPSGYSFNLDGTSIYLSMSVIFMAQVFNVPLSIGQQASVIFILMITSKGAAGVTGSGFLVLASTLAMLKVIPLEGLAILTGVDRFMSEARAITNLIGNGVATMVIAKTEKEFDEEKYRQAIAGQ